MLILTNISLWMEQKRLVLAQHGKKFLRMFLEIMKIRCRGIKRECLECLRMMNAGMLQYSRRIYGTSLGLILKMQPLLHSLYGMGHAATEFIPRSTE